MFTHDNHHRKKITKNKLNENLNKKFSLKNSQKLINNFNNYK